MDKKSKIYVAGHKGLVGSAIVRKLRKDGYSNLVLKTRKDLDLKNQVQTEDFFLHEKPEYVFFAAAKVGGIVANNTYPAEFIYDNTIIAANTIHSAYKSGVKKLINLGSSCIYPKFSKQPIKEEYLLTGSLEPTNEAYAIAKIFALTLCKYYNQQYNTNFMSVMPCNLYGIGDNFDLQNSHVLPAIIRKFYEAKQKKQSQVVLWGDGSSKREFLYSDDLASAVVFLMNQNSLEEEKQLINIGAGKDISIKELSLLIRDVVGYEGEIIWDTSKPNGTPQKLLDISKVEKLGWHAKTKLKDGILQVYEWYNKTAVV